MAITGIGIVVEAISREEGLVGLAVTLFGWSLAISGFIMKIIAKIASIPSFHFSRKQEYVADAMGAELTSPEKMASSLQKIEELNNNLIVKEMAALPYADRWTLRPINPSWIEKLFDTHPPTEKRITVLLSMSTGSMTK